MFYSNKNFIPFSKITAIVVVFTLVSREQMCGMFFFFDSSFWVHLYDELPWYEIVLADWKFLMIPVSVSWHRYRSYDDTGAVSRYRYRSVWRYRYRNDTSSEMFTVPTMERLRIRKSHLQPFTIRNPLTGKVKKKKNLPKFIRMNMANFLLKFPISDKKYTKIWILIM